VPSKFCDENRIKEIVDELKLSGAKKIILLGDIPIKQFAKLFNPNYKKLADFKSYGKFHDLEIDGESYQILPLVHPRQAAKLGRSNQHWYSSHQDWIKEQQTLKK
jgi:uracil-DNA glycosylase